MAVVHRRGLLVGSISVALVSRVRGAAAQQAQQSPLQQLQSLEERARRAGVPTPVGDAARAAPLSAQEQESYVQLMPRLVDLIDRSDESRASDIAEEAADLLGRVHRAERSYAPLLDIEGKARPAPSFDSLRAEYRHLFDTCVIAPKYQNAVNQNVEILKKYRPRYEKVGNPLGIPWHFVGICHAMECGFNFRTHLHNGDPLAAPTVQVPKGRPLPWTSPMEWETSAADAMRYEKFNGQQDWSLERTLYRWEQYNGWGYRGRVNSPYLWSFSNQYTKGKFVRDSVWDPNAPSQQCGTVTMLIGLIASGDVPKL
jgi:lysozyme family protein